MTDKMCLTPSQQEAISEIHNNLQIIACAGSGKTEVITRRIANILKNDPSVTPSNIVAFTFTEKAAESMKSRIGKAVGDAYDIDEMYIGTIHSFCYQLLSRAVPEYSKVRILDTVKNHLFVSRYHSDCGLDDLDLTTFPGDICLFLSCIEKMIDDYEHRETWEPLHEIVLEKYRDCLYDHGYIDFSLLIHEAIQKIMDDPNAKEEIQRIRYLVVDEYQDVDDLQEKLISLIAEEGANICVVGDDDQTIYQFRGSNADNMIGFSKRYPNVHQVRLEANFRCAKEIVEIADTVIRNNYNRLSKAMFAGNTSLKGCVEAKRYEDQEAEYEGIGEKIRELSKNGVPYSEMAILVRKGKYIGQISAVLKSMGIPCKTDSADNFFKEEYFVKLTETLKLLIDLDKMELYELWQDLTDNSHFNQGYRYLRGSIRGRSSIGLAGILQEFCRLIGFLDNTSYEYQQRQDAVDGICLILNDYDQIYWDWQLSGKIEGALRFLEKRAAEEYKYHSFRSSVPEEDAVQIMTVHKSKGLEFHTVFLPELETKEFPVSKMGGKQYWHVLRGTFEENKDHYATDIEDERKLFYVAVTRAKQNLFLSYCLQKQPISDFVREAASAHSLSINRDDLTYCPEKKPRKISGKRGCGRNGSSGGESAEYWEAVKRARRELYDYYGTAAHFFPAARADLMRVKDMGPEEILEEARKNNLI